jgi:hypothetical protein
MNPERLQFLNLRSKPGRFTAEETAWYLGFLVHEIPMLVAAGLLNPLGKPSENGCKFFPHKILDQLNQNLDWQAQASDAIVKYWKDRNLQRPTQNAKARWPNRPAAGACKPRVRGVKPVPLRNPRNHPKP